MKKILLAFTLIALPIAGASNFFAPPVYAATKVSKLGDLSAMSTIVADTLKLVNAGDIKGAIKRVTEFETAWDKNAARLQKLDKKSWKLIDGASDVALSTVRYPSATPAEMKTDLASLIVALNNPN